jgi:hypothetical protein
MRMRTGPVLAFSVAVVVTFLSFGAHTASAQVTPTEPTGGGAPCRIPDDGDGTAVDLNARSTWYWLWTGSASFLAPIRATATWSRPALFAAQGRQQLGATFTRRWVTVR